MKRELIKLSSLGLLLFMFCVVYDAQSAEASGTKDNKDVIKTAGIPAAPGTYQFIVIPTEEGDPFTTDYLIMIENYRDDVQERILPLTQFTKVRIPSKATIQKADYKPLKELVYTPNTKPTSHSK